MAITRGSAIAKQDATPLTPSTPVDPGIKEQETTEAITKPAVSNYEETREQRIKENRERLHKLGIVDLSTQLKSIGATRRTPKPFSERRTPLKSPSYGPTEPVRRSSRLQNAPTVTYVELKEEKKPRRIRDIVLEEGSKPEVYTEEHDKLLGNTEMPWTLFVDGVGTDGKRIYDPVNGKTCHQCRQKTLGLRTHCSTCTLVQGQFCGDCLYMRYGEHVVEANQNPDWICPPCRGICNCSLCRQSRGWAPTGALYRRISSLGFKSVAHYLMATKRAVLTSDDASNTQQSAKRSIPFEGMDVPGNNGSDDITGDEKVAISLECENKATTVTDKPTGESVDAGPESVGKNNLAGDEPCSEKKRGAGKPRTRSMKENVDGNEESARKSEKTDDEPSSEVKRSVGRPRKRPVENSAEGDEESVRGSVMTENEPGSGMKRGVGRPKKKAVQENVDGGEESARKKGIADDEPSSEVKRSVGRPRKRPTEDNVDSDEESVRKSVMTENEPESGMKRGVGRPRKTAAQGNVDGGEETVRKTGIADDEPSSEVKRSVGRPRKRPTEDNLNDDEELVRKSVMTENEPGSGMKRVAGRPRKTATQANADGDEESVRKARIAEDKPEAEITDSDTSSPKMDSIARRLRSSNRT